MAIQNRRGAYSDFDPTKLLPGEYAVVQTGDPDGENGYAVYLCYAAGVVQRLVSADELQAALDNFTVSWNEVSGKPEIDTTLTIPGAIPDSKVVGDILATKAPLSSPAFTGTPTAPTPASADNSGKLATTEFVKDAIAPVSTALTDGLATKADINSPAFTGTPSAPTPASSDSSTRIATTKYVSDAIDTLAESVSADMETFEQGVTNTISGIRLELSTILADIAPPYSESTAYVRGDIVTYKRSLYRYKTLYSRSGPWDASDWEQITVAYAISQLADNIAGQYLARTTYSKGDYVWYLGDLYVCNSDISASGAWDSTKWTAVTLGEVIEERNTVVENTQKSIAPIWNNGGSVAVVYSVGDYVMRNGMLYKCTVAHSSATWISANWTRATVTDLLGNNTTYTDDGDGNITIAFA